MGTQPYNLAENKRVANAAVLAFLQANPSWVFAGYVLVDTDTANMRIFADGKERMLITPERNELMDPKLPCFQVNMDNLRKQMEQSGHD